MYKKSGQLHQHFFFIIDSINSDTKLTVMVKKHASEETYDGLYL